MEAASETEKTAARSGGTAAKMLPYRLTASLIWQDRRFLAAGFLFLASPQLIKLFFLTSAGSTPLLLAALDRFVQLSFLYILTARWLNMMRAKKQPLSLRDFTALQAAGFMFWGMTVAPALAQSMTVPDGIKLLAVAMLIPAIFLTIRYFFYFFPVMIGYHRPLEVLGLSSSLTATDRMIPFKTIITPLALMSVLSALAIAPYPDGRVPALFILSGVMECFFWFLNSCLCIGFCFLLLGDKEWHAAGLDPYRQARFTTLALNAPEYLARILTPASGIRILIVGILLWCANLLHLESMAPAPSVKVSSIAVTGDMLTINADIHDPDYRFSGFQPANFVIAGEQRSLISERLMKASVNGFDKDVRFALPSSEDPKQLTLTFKASRSGKALAALEDLHLWYRHVKLIKLDMQRATVEELPQKGESPAAVPQEQDLAP